MKAKHSLFHLCAALILSTYCLNAQYHLPASVFAGGGAVIQNSDFRISSSVAQTLIGQSQAGSFRKHIGFWRSAQLLTPVEELSDVIPLEYRLDQNYPNPFNPSTTIRFACKERSKVRLVVYNVLGQVVETLVNEQLPAGQYESRFSPTGLASGVYVYRVTANGFVHSRRMRAAHKWNSECLAFIGASL